MSKRVEQFEKQFKKRYNRDVETYLEQVRNGKQLISTVTVISPKGKEYELVDVMDEGKTVIAYLKVDGKQYKYTRYVDCEIHCADLIGEEESGNHN